MFPSPYLFDRSKASAGKVCLADAEDIPIAVSQETELVAQGCTQLIPKENEQGKLDVL